VTYSDIQSLYLYIYLSHHLSISPSLSPLLQDALLLDAVGKFGRNKGSGVKVAAWVSEGSGCVVDNSQCCHRYIHYVDPALQKLNNGPWIKAEVITAHSPHPHYPHPSISRYSSLTLSNPTSSPYFIPSPSVGAAESIRAGAAGALGRWGEDGLGIHRQIAEQDSKGVS
jgi:hypothetical protein